MGPEGVLNLADQTGPGRAGTGRPAAAHGISHCELFPIPFTLSARYHRILFTLERVRLLAGNSLAVSEFIISAFILCWLICFVNALLLLLFP